MTPTPSPDAAAPATTATPDTVDTTPVDAAARVLATWAARSGRGIVFDFNGTLSDDEPILLEIFTRLFTEHLDWPMTADEYRADLLGRSDREIVEIAVARHHDGDPDLVERLLVLRRELYRDAVARRSPITPDAVALVERLGAAGVPMAIVTGAQRPDVDAVLAASPAGRFLPVLVTEEDVTRGKPDPEGLFRAARLLGLESADLLVFEDSVPGITAAARAGMPCVAVTGPDPRPEVVALADATVPALTPRLLAGLAL